MTWFKVDDGFHSHPKVLAAGNEAAGLWVRCCSWSSQHLTQGVIPSEIVALYGSPEAAQRLVDVGLWRVTDGGYKVRDFLRYNPSKKRVEQDRADAAERQRRAREARKARAAEKAADQQEQPETVTNMSQRDRHVTVTPLSHCPDPTRPDPTRTTKNNTLGRATRTPRATAIDPSWQPPQTGVDWARAQGYDDHWARAETVKFVDHFTATGKPMKDWTAAWRNWLRRSTEMNPRNGAATSKPSTPDARVAAALALADQLEAS
jgi:hypothetical protein